MPFPVPGPVGSAEVPQVPLLRHRHGHHLRLPCRALWLRGPGQLAHDLEEEEVKSLTKLTIIILHDI